MPPKLPGLYFDEVRGRYFLAKPDLNQASGEREQKKRKVQLRRQEQVRDLRDKRNNCYLKDASELMCPIKKASGRPTGPWFLGALKIEGSAYDECGVRGTSAQEAHLIDIRGSHLTGHLVLEKSSPDEIFLAVSTISGCILSLRQPFNDEDDELPVVQREDYVTVESLGLSDSPKIVLKLAGDSFTTTGLYCHMTQTESTIHTFIEVGGLGYVHSEIRHRDFSAFRNVNDSINLGRTFVVAADSSLQLSSWTDHSKDALEGFKLSGSKSDVVCLAAKSSHPVVLFAGTRDGWVHAIPISLNETLIRSSIKSFRLPGVRSIVSIKTTDNDDVIFVSAISGHTQTLLLVDIQMTPERCVVASFQTSFLNVTRDQELFEVSPDGRLLLYGSRTSCSGLGDFEVFSSHLTDNFVHDRDGNGISFFPLRTLRNDFLGRTMYGSSEKVDLRCATIMQSEPDIVTNPSYPGMLLRHINTEMMDYFILIIVECAQGMGGDQSARTTLLTTKFL